MNSSLDALTAQVAAVKSVAASATTLVQGLSQRLDQAIQAAKNGDDSKALDALSADLKSSMEPLAAAVQQNTDAGSDKTDEQPTFVA